MMAASFVMALEYLHVSTKSRYESYSLGPSALPSSRREGLVAGVTNSHKISILTSGETLLLQLSLNSFSAIKKKIPTKLSTQIAFNQISVAIQCKCSFSEGMSDSIESNNLFTNSLQLYFSSPLDTCWCKYGLNNINLFIKLTLL